MEPNPSRYGLLSSQRMSKVKDWKGMSNDTGVIRMNEVDQFTWYPFSLANGSTRKIFFCSSFVLCSETATYSQISYFGKVHKVPVLA